MSAFERLFDEIANYLAVVEGFRTAGSEPSWKPERQPSDDDGEGGEQ